MYHSTPYFTVSQLGCCDVLIYSDGDTVQLRPQDAIELANEIIRQGVVVPKPDKPGKEIDLKEVGRLNSWRLEQARKNIRESKKQPPPA
jgi:hypothetical protein